MDEHDAAQAVELVRALCDQLHDMTRSWRGLNATVRPAGTPGDRPPGTKQLPCGETFTRHRVSLTGSSGVTANDTSGPRGLRFLTSVNPLVGGRQLIPGMPYRRKHAALST